MSFNSVLFVKAKDSVETYSLSEYGFDIPLSFYILLSGNVRLSKLSVDSKSSALLEADFDTGYDKLFWFLQSCLAMQIIEPDLHESLVKQAHFALDSFYEQKANIYLQIVSNVELIDLDDMEEDDDFGSMILTDIENTLSNLHSVFNQLRDLKRCGNDEEIEQTLLCPWSEK